MQNYPYKVAVIGWDSATLTALNPLLTAGALPHLQQLIAQGSTGKLFSTLHPLTPPAWTTMMTGVNPGKHGIFDFVGLSKERGFQVMTGADVYAETLWSRLSRSGKRVVVANVPMTYPPEAVNGYLIAGMDAPRQDRAYTHPPALGEELEQHFGAYCVDVKARAPAGMSSNAFTQKYIDELCAQVRQQADVADYLLARETPDFCMFVFTAPDRVQHVLGELLSQGVTPEDGIGQVYRACDEALGRILDRLDDDWCVFVVSDHGACTYRRVFELSTWLVAQGWLTLRPPAQTQQLSELWGRVRRQFARWLHLPIRQRPGLQQFLNQIVWEKTYAFSLGAFGSIYINSRERFEHGIVHAGAEYDALCTQITERLLAARDPETDAAIVKAVYRGTDVYQGDYLNLAPDLLVETHNDYFVRNNLDHHEMRLTYPAGQYGERTLAHTARHHKEGVLMAAGPAFASRQPELQAHLADLAPTILHLMGLSVPNSMDGAPLRDWYTAAFLTAQPVEVADDDTKMHSVSQGYSPEEREVVAQRLRDLGYLD
ncbi:MAG: alkaline phosphatase family protein [Caldilineaceae bacterium]